MKKVKAVFWQIFVWSVVGSGVVHLLAPEEYHWLEGWQVWVCLAILVLGFMVVVGVKVAKEEE